jgi:S1-C subfamily serine protease
MLRDAIKANDQRKSRAPAKATPAPLVGRTLFGGYVVGAAVLGVLLLSSTTFAQDVEAYKRGVVRIHNTRLNVTGTGFIVRLDGDRAYVVTAAHVVRGDAQPDVYFFNRPHDPAPAKLINREDSDDLKGLAFLHVRAGAEVLRGLTPLRLSSTPVRGGETVVVIGFPDGTDKWSVTRATVSRLDGRELVFAGPVKAGNSGGPVLLDGQVIGLVTDTIQESGYASQSGNLLIYIRGIDPKTADSLTQSVAEASARTDPPDGSQFCQALSQIVSAGRDNFYSIVKGGSKSGDVYESSVKLPGTSVGLIYPDRGQFSFTSDKGGDYYQLVSKIKQCLRGWKQGEVPKEGEKSEFERGADTKEYLFTESDAGVVVKVSLTTYRTGGFVLTNVSVYAPNSALNPARLRGSTLSTDESIIDFLSDGEKVEELCQAVRKISDASQDGFFSIVGKAAAMPRRFDLTFRIPGFPEGTVIPRDKVEFHITAFEAKEREGIYYKLVAAVKPCLQGWQPKETTNDAADPKARFNSYSYQFLNTEKGPVVEIRTSRLGVVLTVYSHDKKTR